MLHFFYNTETYVIDILFYVLLSLPVNHLFRTFKDSFELEFFSFAHAGFSSAKLKGNEHVVVSFSTQNQKKDIYIYVIKCPQNFQNLR